MPSLLHADITAPVIDSFRFLYRQLGFGFFESVCCNGLVVELRQRNLTIAREVAFKVLHRGAVIGHYRADMVVEDRVLIEVKATQALSPADERQLLNYLKAARSRSVCYCILAQGQR